MIVIWSSKAKESLKKIIGYIFLSFGEKTMEKFKKKVFQTEKTLAINPNIGPIEPLLNNYPKVYRSIVVNNLNKIVYYIKNDIIHIAAIWDTRREPKSLIKDLESPEEE